MFDLKNIQNYTFQVLFAALVLIICVYNWRRRFLYYHASKFSGPFSLPLIGCIYLFRNGHKDLYQTMEKIAFTYKTIFRLWVGPVLVIITARPKDIEYISNHCLDKSSYYDYGKEFTRDGLLTASVPKWSIHRKIINPIFNSKMLNSYVRNFVEQSKILVNRLRDECDTPVVILPQIFRCSLDTACETLCDVKATSVTGQDKFIENVMRMEELVTLRLFNIWLQPNFVWNFSSLGKEMSRRAKETFGFTKRIVDLRRSERSLHLNEKDEDNKDKRFLNCLLQNKNEKKQFNESEIYDETQVLLITASETTALTISMVLLALAALPEVQKEIQNELRSILGSRSADVTLDDINKMVYLESVIKETMRLFPTVPLITRSVYRDVLLESGYIVPAGSHLGIPIALLHRHPDYWKNPEDFNPRRFLDKEQASQHPCVYIPFGYGIRNCIGFKYGMISMKVTLAVLLRHFRVKPVTYKKIEDIKLSHNLLTKSKDGYEIVLQENKIE